MDSALVVAEGVRKGGLNMERLCVLPGVAYGYDDANWQQQTGVAWGAQYAQYRVPPPPVTGRDSQSFAR